MGVGGWVVGDCENKANSAQLGLAGALAELGNSMDRVEKSQITWLPENFAPVVLSQKILPCFQCMSGKTPSEINIFVNNINKSASFMPKLTIYKRWSQ